MAKRSFYKVGSGEGYLRGSFYLEVRRQIDYRDDRVDLKPFLNVPVKGLEKQLKESQTEEKRVFEEMKKAATAWDEHGTQTLLLQKAIEYLKTPEVTHTHNEWQRHKDSPWEISDLVYEMTFNIVKSSDEQELTWGLPYVASGLSQGYWGYTRSPRRQIGYKGSKKYKTTEGAQKYIQNKFDQYTSCFKSLSPPILIEVKESFCVNDQLLQGYSFQPPVPQREKITLENLLNCLGDGDVAAPSETQPASGESAPPAEEKPQAGPPLPVQVQTQTADGGKQESSPVKTAHPTARKKPLHRGRLAMARQGVGTAHTRITPGREIEVSARYYPDKKVDRVVKLIQLPREELITMEKASVAQEKAIFLEFSEIEAEWRKQAVKTITICKTGEYLRALPVEHTSNQWRVSRFGWNVLSSMVYKMLYRVSENKAPGGTLISCTLSWDIHYSTLRHPIPDYTSDGWKIAGQSDKRFTIREGLERYLQDRIRTYAHLFTEASPPIPKEEGRCFSVNGTLLPGYTVGVPLEKRVEEIFSFPEDDPALLEEPLSSGHQGIP